MFFTATFLSSCSSLTSTAVSPIYRTLSSSAFPAVYTVLIYSSACSFQVLSILCFLTWSVIWAAWFFIFPTTWDWKWLISWIYVLTVCWQLYTSWHHLPNISKRSVMVAVPYSKACLISLRRCPSLASVSWARAVIYWELAGGGTKVFAWMFTVRLSRFDRSGSWSASALKSTGVRAGAVGGSNSPSTKAILSADTS